LADKLDVMPEQIIEYLNVTGRFPKAEDPHLDGYAADDVLRYFGSGLDDA